MLIHLKDTGGGLGQSSALAERMAVGTSSPLLTTKLYIPPPHPNLVSRPRLIERLDEGLRLGRKLTLVSAPAGFGKTTLVTSLVTLLINDVATTATALVLVLDDYHLIRIS